MPEGRQLLCNEWRPDEPGETLSEALPRLFQNIGLKRIEKKHQRNSLTSDNGLLKQTKFSID